MKLTSAQEKLLKLLGEAKRVLTVEEYGKNYNPVAFIEEVNGFILPRQYQGTAISNTVMALVKKGVIEITPVRFIFDYIHPTTRDIVNWSVAHEALKKLNKDPYKKEVANYRLETISLDEMGRNDEFLIKLNKDK